MFQMVRNDGWNKMLWVVNQSEVRRALKGRALLESTTSWAENF